MKFVNPLKCGYLIRRYQRFLADVDCVGETLTVHCPNTGAMRGCSEPGSTVWLSHSDNPKRRYAWTWELVKTSAGVLVGVHTGRTNALAGEALQQRMVPPLAAYQPVRREVKIPGGRGRFDWLLENEAGDPCWVEVKNVTAAVSDGVAVFPDAVSARASRHARELTRLSRAGYSTALIFCVQRMDVRSVRPAHEIDPDYARALAEAVAAGVIVTAVRCRVTQYEITPEQMLPVHLS